MNIEETNKVLWKYSKKKATYELQKEKGLSFNNDVREDKELARLEKLKNENNNKENN